MGHFIELSEITLGFCPARIKGVCERWLYSPNLHLSPTYPTRSSPNSAPAPKIRQQQELQFRHNLPGSFSQISKPTKNLVKES